MTQKSDALPTLHFVREVFAEDQAQLARTVGMILVIISAHLHALDARRPLSTRSG